MDHNKLWKILKEMGIPDHLTCLLRNLYPSQEATARTGHGTTGSKLRKEFVSAVYGHSAYLTYAEYTMQNAGLMNHKLESGLWGEKHQQPQICR